MISLRPSEDSGAKGAGATALCVAGFMMLGVAGYALNASVYAHVSTYCGIAREIATLVNAAAFLALFLAATLRPRLIDQRQLTTIAAGCALTAALVLEFGLAGAVPWATIAGLACASVASAWAATTLVCAILGLRSLRRATVAIAIGTAIGEAAAVAHPPIPFNIGAVETLACYAVVMLGLYRLASPVFARIAAGDAPIDLEVANPESFLSPSNGLFLCALLFSIATGYGLTFGEVDRAPASIGTSVIVIAGAALWLLFSRSRDKEDTLFSFCVLMVIGGFIVTPFMFLSDLASANALLRIGVRCFDMLVWLVVVAVGSRNPLALLPTFALIRSLNAFGTDLGAVAGHTTNELIGVDGTMAALIAEGVLFLFVALLWTRFRSFSFTDAIRGVVAVGRDGQARGPRASGTDYAVVALADPEGGTPAAATLEDEAAGPSGTAAEPPTAPPEPSIEERCAAIGATCGLTEREVEIFALLARGRNGQFLMDYYVVSRNTVKSHIKHIYAKLGVHSQQELIDRVEYGS